ncbi:MAG: NAD(P)H-hydrate dehydratase [Microgenomates group bacterium]
MTQFIKTNDDVVLKKIFKRFILAKNDSHKGQNGKILIIGGSSLFHAASLWAAETASHFVDMVHYCSTEENEKIFLNLKTKFRNGIIVRKDDLLKYAEEDDVILIGPGMIRGKISNIQIKNQKDLINIKDEALYTYFLTQFLIENFPEKKFVIDAGSLQMMDKDWLLKLKTKPIITPHQKEFEKLFAEKIIDLNFEEKINLVEKIAKKYNIVILLKAVNDIISDSDQTVVVEGGNQGLTKGGTGDVLAALAASFYVKNESFDSAVFASIVLKKAADELFNQYGYWYNVSKIIDYLPKILKNLKKL